MFLTNEELRELTDYFMPSAQCRWLEKNGWEFAVSRLGRPKVLRAYAEQRLGIGTYRPKIQSEPDFSHWQGLENTGGGKGRKRRKTNTPDPN